MIFRFLASLFEKLGKGTHEQESCHRRGNPKQGQSRNPDQSKGSHRQLRKAARKYRKFFEEGGLLRNSFVETTLALLAPDVKVADLPAVARVLWSVGDFAGLLQAAHSSAEEILWVAHPPTRVGWRSLRRV
jgi:hypothetical protein